MVVRGAVYISPLDLSTRHKLLEFIFETSSNRTYRGYLFKFLNFGANQKLLNFKVSECII